MKKLITVVFVLFYCLQVQAQSFASVDRSVLDIAYLPHNFAHDREDGEEAIVKVVYSRPLKNDRVIFGGLVPYGKVWRTGANEATEIRFYRDVTFGGKEVKAGTYSLFTIPGEKEWTIILSNDVDHWGAFSYNESSDLLRIQAPVKTLDSTQETFTIQFTKKGETPANMMLAWDNTLVEVPVEY